MAPGIEIPVVPVIGEPLRGDLPLDALLRRPIVVTQQQPLALSHRFGHLSKSPCEGTGAHLKDPYASYQTVGAGMLQAQELIDSFLEGLEVGIQQPGLYAGQELLNRKERVKLRRIEPETRELVHVALPLVIAVTIAFPVVDNRSV